MNIATIKVSGVKAVTNDYPTIPAGIVGATVTFEFTDPAWDGLNKTAVFRGCVTRDVLMTGNVVRIPAETVAQACPFLFVGIYGTDAADNLVIPTLWLSLGAVRDSADPSGDPGTDPDLPVWAQLQDRVEALESGTPSDPDSPGTPGRPGEDGEDGGYYTPAVTQPSSDIVEFAFSPSKPDMPTVDPVQVKLPVSQNSGGNVDLTGYATEQFVRDGYQPKGNYLTEVPEGYAKSSEIPTKPEDIGAQPAGNYALKTEIPSVPVQSVNDKTGAVKLSASDVGARPDNWMPTAQEVGALPNTTVIPTVPTKISAFENDVGYIKTIGNTAPDANGNINLLNFVYPVGSIYMSVQNASPASLFGGTWEQLKDRFLLAAGDSYKAGDTGGEASHTLTVDEMPTHKHKQGTVLQGNNFSDFVTPDDGVALVQNTGAVFYNKGTTIKGSEAAMMNECARTGGDQAHNNMPPYLAVYMWKRTA